MSYFSVILLPIVISISKAICYNSNCNKSLSKKFQIRDYMQAKTLVGLN